MLFQLIYLLKVWFGYASKFNLFIFLNYLVTFSLGSLLKSTLHRILAIYSCHSSVEPFGILDVCSYDVCSFNGGAEVCWSDDYLKQSLFKSPCFNFTRSFNEQNSEILLEFRKLNLDEGYFDDQAFPERFSFHLSHSIGSGVWFSHSPESSKSSGLISPKSSMWLYIDWRQTYADQGAYSSPAGTYRSSWLSLINH
jgi:hypothetical protein